MKKKELQKPEKPKEPEPEPRPKLAKNVHTAITQEVNNEDRSKNNNNKINNT